MPELVIRAAELHHRELSNGSTQSTLEGSDHDLPLSFTQAMHVPSGVDTPTHRHETQSIMILRGGSGHFTIGDEQFDAEGGDIVIVPAHVWHSFRVLGDEPLHLIGVTGGP